ncbi:anaerobic ribonucleoside-triphosphate reductase activating protein [Muribaculum intestinale]|uniref:anaerobic ribonucleoside-triphosphate reductase activating protein n=1 Tax=Muribaculum intestinale TaxID=1796646 RepID=UPI0026EEFA33|nr:anaerobic ribonucleoside-triphosphate reductase activating protein [Muribaculum intestinale]
MKVNVLDIVRGTTVDGPGFRTSVYMAGCRHACPGCHNPQSWDFNGGTLMDIEELMAVVEEEDWDVTLTGGDPMYHPGAVMEIARRVHELGHDIWVYTGFTWEDLIKKEELSNVLRLIDVIVDGPYHAAERDTDLLFRGSRNQRIIDVASSLESGMVMEWQR